MRELLAKGNSLYKIYLQLTTYNLRNNDQTRHSTDNRRHHYRDAIDR